MSVASVIVIVTAITCGIGIDIGSTFKSVHYWANSNTLGLAANCLYHFEALYKPRHAKLQD